MEAVDFHICYMDIKQFVFLENYFIQNSRKMQCPPKRMGLDIEVDQILVHKLIKKNKIIEVSNFNCSTTNSTIGVSEED